MHTWANSSWNSLWRKLGSYDDGYKMFFFLSEGFRSVKMENEICIIAEDFRSVAFLVLKACRNLQWMSRGFGVKPELCNEFRYKA